MDLFRTERESSIPGKLLLSLTSRRQADRDSMRTRNHVIAPIGNVMRRIVPARVPTTKNGQSRMAFQM